MTKQSKSEEIREKLSNIFNNALCDATNYLNDEMFDPNEITKELEKYIDYLQCDIIKPIDENLLLADEIKEKEDRTYQSNDAWYDQNIRYAS
ncbi:MAG: hypothetical protein BWY78_01169 [Alphaproteobacteria bacterium ADurb.Bin438]|nr:MAG: hypothetical protein BWY78_01169 [Alphaproteobacteria bacterium ADurb.Bin438]